MPHWRNRGCHKASKTFTCGVCAAPILKGERYWRDTYHATDTELRGLSDEIAAEYPLWTARYQCRVCELGCPEHYQHMSCKELRETVETLTTEAQEGDYIPEVPILETLLGIREEQIKARKG